MEHADDLLDVEIWASEWVGQAWLRAEIGQREPEHKLYRDVVERAKQKPSPAGLIAVAALRRLAPESEQNLLGGAVDSLLETQPRPPWMDAPAWEAVAAWRAVDVWESERVLFVQYRGPHPHVLMAAISEVGGRRLNRLALLEPAAVERWEAEREPDEVPMPLSSLPAADVLADLADTLRQVDRYWPKYDHGGHVELRTLAWSRCRAHLPELRGEWQGLGDEERQRLIDDFVAVSGLPDDEVTRSLAEEFAYYGDGYIAARPLGWSPGWVAMFLGDYLPRKVVLDAEQRAALPEALRRWVRFALDRRGVEARWIQPVVAAVDEYLPEFEENIDDANSWGLAKTVVAELEEHGVDMDDREAVEQGIRQLNAIRLARTLTDH